MRYTRDDFKYPNKEDYEEEELPERNLEEEKWDEEYMK